MPTAQPVLATRRPNNSQIATKDLAYQLQTSQMLTMLSRIFPRQTWTANWLHSNASPSYSFGNGVTLTYAGQPFGSGTQHVWEIKISDSRWAEVVSQAHDDISSRTIVPTGLQPRRDGTYEWNSLIFRSLAEIEIAKALAPLPLYVVCLRKP